MVKVKSTIEVIGAHFAFIGLGLIILSVARLANTGVSIEDVVSETKKEKE
jgi:fatty acid-binding protein DegV